MMTIDPTSLPLPTFFGGTKAITFTPVVGTPRREYADMFVGGIRSLHRTGNDGAQCGAYLTAGRRQGV
jgi:hypothetical protein